MENASKALIIAGAILLSILIIALGMRIFNSASNSAAGADLSAQEVSAFNSQFLAYEGKFKGSQVKKLLNEIESNNNNFVDRTISVSYTKVSGTTSTTYDTVATIRPEIVDTTTYKISFDYTNTLISSCTIEKAN